MLRYMIPKNVALFCTMDFMHRDHANEGKCLVRWTQTISSSGHRGPAWG